MATWPRRLLARTVDWLVTGLPLAIVLAVGNSLKTSTGDVSVGPATAVGLLGGFTVLLLDLYNRGYLEGATGQSWGKRLLHLRVVRMADEQPIGPRSGIARELAHLAITLLWLPGLLSWAFAIWDPGRQTLGDKIMHTVVLSEGRPGGSEVTASQR